MNTPIGSIYSMTDDTVIQEVSGRIMELQQPRRGIRNRDKKPYCFQEGKLHDGTTEIPFETSDRDIPMDWVGRDVVFKSSHTGQHGWNGVKKITDTYDAANPKVLIRVTRTADIVDIASGQSAPTTSAQTPPPPPHSGTQANPSAAGPTPPPFRGSTNQPPPGSYAANTGNRPAVPGPKVRLEKMRRGYMVALAMAELCRREWFQWTGEDLGVDNLDKMAGRLFVPADKSGLLDALEVDIKTPMVPPRFLSEVPPVRKASSAGSQPRRPASQPTSAPPEDEPFNPEDDDVPF